MKKSRAIFLLITTVVVIGGYVALAVWRPAPTLQSMTFQDADAFDRSAAEADFRSHPPKRRKLTWQDFLSRLIYPYQERESPLIKVQVMDFRSYKLLVIFYPREQINLVRRPDGRWHRPTDP